MWFGLLGPLRVLGDSGNALQVRGGRQRVLLAALLMRPRLVVSGEELIDVIWDGEAPASAQVTLRSHVKRLRQGLGAQAGARIVTQPAGYSIEVSDDELDVRRFAKLCERGTSAARAASWDQASGYLSEALALWRGPPLADIRSETLRRDEVPYLEELRLQALESRIETDLADGRLDDIVSELRSLTAGHPLRERFWHQLMQVLEELGRPAEALEVYARARETIADELGANPGIALQQLHQRILLGGTTRSAREPRPAAGPVSMAVPRQLPAAVLHFVGRTHELQKLSKLLAEDRGAAGVARITAIGGTAGVGKTALALHWAHQAADKFPDGQLYADLRGYHPAVKAADPAEVIGGFLSALQVHPERIPASLEAQAGLYRSLVAGKRMLVMLDNARDDAQVRPLLPGSLSCRVIVTSRRQLEGLAAAEGACLLNLDVLTDAEAADLFACRLGVDRLRAEPEAVTELTRQCARLPLALSIAAARAAPYPHLPLTALAAELADRRDRLDALDSGDPNVDVRTVFSWSYRHLGGSSARMFRLLGLHPGPNITVPAAASLAGVPLADARKALRGLIRASLVAEPVAGRFAFHDLLRAYAVQQAEACDTERERRQATIRMLDHYLHTAEAAAHALDPTQHTLACGSPAGGVTPEAIVDCDQALAWFGAEHEVLLTVTRQAAETDFGHHARQLPRSLVTYLDGCGRWQDLASLQHVALVCSQRLGDLDGQAHAHRNLGRAYLRLDESDLALTHLRKAVQLSERLGDQPGQARAHLHLSVVYEQAGQLRNSLYSSLRALELAKAASHPALRAVACNNIGYDYAMLGDFQQALSYCLQALDEQRRLGDPSQEANTWDSLGYVHHHLGDYHRAMECYLHALGLFRDLSSRYLYAKTLSRLGDTYYAAGDNEAARDIWQQAMAIFDKLAHSYASHIRVKLDDLDTATCNSAARGATG